MPAMADPNLVIDNAVVLIRAAHRLGVPVMVSRQYPKGLGDIVGPLREIAGNAALMDKVEFSCFANADMRKVLRESGRDQFILAGVEAHVCVLQTALDLVREGYQVAVVEDATSSRRHTSHDVALRRAAQGGIEPVTTEMVVFEWLRHAGHEAFKDLSALIR